MLPTAAITSNKRLSAKGFTIHTDKEDHCIRNMTVYRNLSFEEESAEGYDGGGVSSGGASSDQDGGPADEDEAWSGDEKTYVIEKVIKTKLSGKNERKREWLVKWVGYTEAEATWENLQSFLDDDGMSQALIEYEMERSHKLPNLSWLADAAATPWVAELENKYPMDGGFDFLCFCFFGGPFPFP